MISGLLREALAPAPDLAYEVDVPVFAVREDAPPITADIAKAAGEDS